MKNLTKLFVAVAVLFAGFACTTDATEDLGVQVNGADQTEIVLSLEESRTQLGEKVGDIYPLYWSEGDKIAVNGVAAIDECRFCLWHFLQQLWNTIGNYSFNFALGGARGYGDVYAVRA